MYTDEENGGNRLPYLYELAKTLGMPYVSFGCATEDGYFGTFGYGNALLSRFRKYVCKCVCMHVCMYVCIICVCYVFLYACACCMYMYATF